MSDGEMKWDHKSLVRRAARWLRVSQGCNVVFAELTTQNNETPDVIGFHGAGASILVECKVSRSDFLADRNKIFRVYEDLGMGDLRYFACPVGMVLVDDLPDGWGFLAVSEHQVRLVREAVSKPGNKRAEVKMLMSAIRRLELSTAVFVRQDVSEGIS